MQEIWQENIELVDKNEWGKLITSFESTEFIKNKEEAKKNLRELFIAAVKKRLPQEKLGIFFSGGVDSGFIAAVCKLLGKKFTCYVVGFQDETKEPEDVIEAKKVAAKLGFELKYKVFNLQEVEEIIKKTVSILKKVDKTDVVNIGVGAVVLAAAEMGIYSGVKCFFSGLGSEEIFAGYERHGKAKDAHQECFKGLKEMWSRDLVRDFTLAQELKVKIMTPFLDEDLIKYAMKIPAEWKIDHDYKKVILREVAQELLGDFAWRKKKAAQYGSCFDKAISKIARQNGFKYKKEWLDSLS